MQKIRLPIKMRFGLNPAGSAHAPDTDPFSEIILTQLRSDLDSMEVGDLLRFIATLQQCRENKGRPDRPSRNLGLTEDITNDALSHLIRASFFEYRTRVGHQVSEWLGQSSWERHGEITHKIGRHLATNDPEDIMYVINMQMSVAREHLSPFLCMDVLITVLEEVQHMQKTIRKSLNSSSKNLVIEGVCAIVNDCACLYERLDELSLTEDLFGGEILPSYKVKKKKDQVAAEYINLAVYATDTLSQMIMFDLKPIFSKFHSLQWEHDDDIGIILSTFQDYFRDLSLWLPPFFYAKCIRNCLEHLLEKYVESFFTQQCHLNAETKAALLGRDRINLVQFFGIEYLEEMKQTGLGGMCHIENRFEILRAMQNVILAGSPFDVSNEIMVILSELGHRNGKTAVLYLRSISISDQQPLRKKQEFIVWSSTIDDACKANPAFAIRARTHCEISYFRQSHVIRIVQKKKKSPEKILNHYDEQKRKNQIVEQKTMARRTQPKATQHQIEKIKAILFRAPAPKLMYDI